MAMATKRTRTPAAPFEPATFLGHPLAEQVKASAQDIWLAGLGALAKAQEEGERMFSTLVEDGVRMQRTTQTVAQEKLDELTARMAYVGQRVGATSAQTAPAWDRLETIFEERVAKAMAALGMPTAQEVRALHLRVDELTRQVDALTRATRHDEAAAAAPSSPRRPRASKA
jgi:poly(hydroxyalkanoate) granule-associated protein